MVEVPTSAVETSSRRHQHRELAGHAVNVEDSTRGERTARPAEGAAVAVSRTCAVRATVVKTSP